MREELRKEKVRRGEGGIEERDGGKGRTVHRSCDSRPIHLTCLVLAVVSDVHPLCSRND